MVEAVESSTELVYQAVTELRELEQVATRESVTELTGLKLSIVDDRLRTLVNDGRLKRLIRGVYELAQPYLPARPMFFGILTDGRVKLEIGDDVLTLTPHEARRMARAMGGFAEDARVLESTRQHLIVAADLTAKVRAHELALCKLTGEQQGLPDDSGRRSATPA